MVSTPNTRLELNDLIAFERKLYIVKNFRGGGQNLSTIHVEN